MIVSRTDPADADAVVQRALNDAQLHKALLDQLDTGVYIVDCDRRILYWNGAAEHITGYLAHEVAGQFCHGDLFLHYEPDGGSVFLRHRRGHLLPVRVGSRSIHDASGGVIGAVEVFEEAVAHARHAIRELHAFGCLDPLTGAANRRYGEMRVRQALDALNQFGVPFGWLRIRLDHTAAIEQRCGHGLTEAAMKMIFGTLDANLGSLDVLTRWAASEFRVEVHYSSRVELAEAAEKLMALVRASGVEWWGDRVHATVSIGGATAEYGDTIESLEARVGEVFESCEASGGDRAAVVAATAERRSCSR